MGLDMYLTAKKYIGGGNWEREEEKKLNNKIRDIFPEMFKTDNLNYIEVTFETGYWRKANAIHQWFVDNVQDGNDNCDSYYVSREQLELLKDKCEQVLSVAKTGNGKITVSEKLTKDGWEKVLEDGIVVTNPEDVNEILPPQSGFFFGSTDINEYYLNDMKETIDIIDRCLKLPKDWNIYYHSSW